MLLKEDFSLKVDNIRSHLHNMENMNSWQKGLLLMIQKSNHFMLYEELIFV
jgi:hypothetical protein